MTTAIVVKTPAQTIGQGEEVTERRRFREEAKQETAHLAEQE